MLRRSAVLSERRDLQASFADAGKGAALKDILRVGTSAGGARAKAVIAWNPATNEVRSGQVAAGDGFDYWLLKFDGVNANRDKELNDPKGYGVIEYAYHLMARAAGITMSECRLLEENGRRHFMTKRFDRLPDGEKLHMQSLGALAHYDFNSAGAYSYEQALLAMRQLHLPPAQVEEQFRRMVFNILIDNTDDHEKNHALIMTDAQQYALSPAYDVLPSGQALGFQQMRVGEREADSTLANALTMSQMFALRRDDAVREVRAVVRVVDGWKEHFRACGVTSGDIDSYAEQIDRPFLRIRSADVAGTTARARKFCGPSRPPSQDWIAWGTSTSRTCGTRCRTGVCCSTRCPSGSATAPGRP